MKRTVFENGIVYAGRIENPWREAVVVEGETILFTGSRIEARRIAGGGAQSVDLRGALLLPGFIDAHAHLAWGGQYLEGVDLSKAASKDEFISILGKYAASHQGAWITGGNWNHYNWRSAELPHKDWINGVTGDTPALLSRMDYHIALANSTALRLAGITAETPDPAGGAIDRGTNNEPTGILRDTAIDIVNAAIPPPSREDMERSIIRALREMNSFGVASVHDISEPGHIPVYEKLEAESRLTCRIFSRLPLEHFSYLNERGIVFPTGSPYLKLGSLKAFADGSLGAATALFATPYADNPGEYGLAMDLLSSVEKIKLMGQAVKQGIQLSIHAIGDKAVNDVLNLFESFGAGPRLLRVEHAQHLLPEDIARFARLGVIASMQPYHLFEDGAWMETKIGKERMPYAYSFGSLLRAGAPVCFGSDFPIVTCSPVQGIYAAVTRRAKNSALTEGIEPQEKISVAEAVDCYTRQAAYAAGEETTKGTIERGKFADFAVLDRNIFTAEPESIAESRILMTVCGGEIVFDGETEK